ncbi:FAD-dependent oxidoreductase [Pseudanabaena sp. PCC 6802]|uniref:FAD-dependent oxidoreductase n=1 Tax=Pseudanabaena sp. PCC 6802 TaxID=118173 RepID=UPI00034A4F67|nr:FAD-dependent oxidoreductase [Pseudanabaena sp. PCC 6802]
MAVDYDLAIIGNGEKAVLLAQRAAQLKARVALVTEASALEFEHLLACLGQMLRDRTPPEQFPQAIARTQQDLYAYNRLEFLQALGVDVILGTGQFSDRATFTTAAPSSRDIRARAFAIAGDRPPQLRQIMGLDEIAPLTYEHLLHLDKLPKQVAVIGGRAIDCTIAQILCRLGYQVALFTDGPHILADLDVEIARILQAQLEVDGAKIYTSTRITAVTKLERSTYQVWAGDLTFRYEQILLPSWHLNYLQAPYDRWENQLNLARAGISFSVGEIRVNRKRQTTNRRIYICQHRTDIHTILTNTLFLPIAKVAKQDRAMVPQAIAMSPPNASVGMNEIEARLQYGQDLYVLHQTDGENPGSYKLLCRHNGKIVGAHAVGSNAISLIETVAIAMHSKLNIYQLSRLSDAVPSPIAQLAVKLDEQIYSRNLRKQRWLERWFNWRRQWDIRSPDLAQQA